VGDEDICVSALLVECFSYKTSVQ